MKLAVFSNIEGKWTRGGEKIEINQNHIINEEKNDYYYSLRFEYEFQHDNDVVYFAYAVPYTYTELSQYITKLTDSSPYIKKYTLCKTIGGLKCQYLLANDKEPSTKNQLLIKRLAVFTARVHPGETMSSWMIKGVMDLLVADTPIANLLRQNFVFLIIPMLNPDGVVYGNYRACAVGSDLNRKYINPSEIFHPTIYYAKRLIKNLSKTYPIGLYIDFHGHSAAYFY